MIIISSTFTPIICPICKGKRFKEHCSTAVNASDFHEVICKAGFNVNPEANKVTTTFLCLECNREFTVIEKPTYINPCITCELECNRRVKT